MITRKAVLQKASELITGDRDKEYGDHLLTLMT